MEDCLMKNLMFEGISVTYKKEDGNFEAWARDVRYNFFKDGYRRC